MSLELSLYLLVCLFMLGAICVFYVRQSQHAQNESEEHFVGPDEKAPEAPTAAPHFSGILTARPDGMDYNTYCQVRREQNKRLRSYLRRGTLVYLAAELYMNGDKVMRRTYLPFVGSTKALKLSETLCSKRTKEAPAL